MNSFLLNPFNWFKKYRIRYLAGNVDQPFVVEKSEHFRGENIWVNMGCYGFLGQAEGRIGDLKYEEKFSKDKIMGYY
jgi:hypothetical protein